MKLQFTYDRGDGRRVDLHAQLETTTTIGQLAAHLAVADPRTPSLVGSPDGWTLCLDGSPSHVLDPQQLVAESALSSGASLALRRAPDPHAAAVVGRLSVLVGPDAGRTYDLRAGSVFVGREASCDVVLTDPLVSRRHARLNVGDTIEIVDQGSANGIEVSGDLVVRTALAPDDVVILGDTQFVVESLVAGPPTAGAVDFIRPARVVEPYEGREYEAPVPPERSRTQRFPTVALIAPLIMGGVLYLVTDHILSVLFAALSPMMLVASAIESRIVSRRDFREAVKEFGDDIDALVDHITSDLARERAARVAAHPSSAACRAAAIDRDDLLWSRRTDDVDFATLSLGLGTRPSRSTVLMPRRNRAPFELVQRLEEALDPLTRISSVPVVADLNASAIGVAGPRQAALAAARSLIVQAVVLHSPADLTVAAVLGTSASSDWDWLKWLPHSTSTSSPLNGRQLTASQASCLALVTELEVLVESRGEARSGRVLLIVDSDAPVEHSRLVALAENGPRVGIHVVWIAPSRTELPAACRVFTEQAPDDTARVGYATTGESVKAVAAELISLDDAMLVARSLAPVADIAARNSDESDLPRSITQFQLLGPDLGSSGEAVLERWIANSSVLSGPRAPVQTAAKAGNLRAVLGQSAAGPHALDLRVDGPHALVGGTTGAGKSELLQAWILALAAAHSPERVTFLLVDYKGGSAFSDCVQLPHTIGLVTDLSPPMVRRALVSLSAELRHREELLASHGAKDLIELESHGVVDAPPSLVIVIDEFAALVAEVPEFVDGVVNVAQRGRSLGLHLILATQQPSGVIKGNLRANTNLRVALRMADQGDSTDVLGSDAAASFDPEIPGRAISKSGSRRLMPFQTAYAGGWTSEVPGPPDLVVEELHLTQPVRWEAPPSGTPVVKDRQSTDIKRLVRTIQAANALAEIAPPRKAWLPVLPAVVDLADIAADGGDRELVFALGDDPAHQTQPAVSFRPDREGNLAVYGTGGSGKSTLLRSIAIAAGMSGDSCEVHALDFGSRGMAMLEELPHVGSVITGSDHERVTRLLDWLRRVIDERAARFSAVRASTITDYRRLSGRSEEARILVLLDGVAAFRQAYETTERMRYLDLLTAIASEGRPVGVHLILSSDQRTGVQTALGATVQRRIVLRMASDDDYSLLGVPFDVLDAHSSPGRGLDGDREIQVAVLGNEGNDVSQAEEIRDLAAQLRARGTRVAEPVRRLPDLVSLTDLDKPRGAEVVVGLGSAELMPIGVDARACFLVTGPPGSGRSTALATLLESARTGLADAEFYYLGNRRSALSVWDGWRHSATDADEISALARELTEALPRRAQDAGRVVVVVEGIGDHVAGPLDAPLQALAKACIAEDQWMLVEGEISTVRGGMGVLATVKSSRRGLLLQPDQDTGLLLFNTALPRLNRSELPPGRGYLIGSGAARLTQTAVTGPGRR